MLARLQDREHRRQPVDRTVFESRDQPMIIDGFWVFVPVVCVADFVVQGRKPCSTKFRELWINFATLSSL
jgi:hypothetical protein